MKKSYNERREEWRMKMKDLKVITVSLTLITIILGYHVMEHNLIDTPLCKVSFFFCAAAAMSFSYLLYVGGKGTLEGYNEKRDGDED